MNMYKLKELDQKHGGDTLKLKRENDYKEDQPQPMTKQQIN